MELQEIDVQKFYMLLSHYNPTSCNIGIIGNKEKFNKYLKKVIKRIGKYDALYMNQDKTKCTLLLNDIEYTYIQIKDPNDLRSYYFRKFI